MKDEAKTKEPLLNELVKLRQRIAEMKRLETEQKKAKGALQKTNQALKKEIEERKRAEEMLREFEQKYNLLLRASPDIVVFSDLEGNIIEFSQRAMKHFGFKSAEEVIGRNAAELLAPESHETLKRTIKKALKQGLSENVEYTCLKKDGTRFIVETNGAIVKDAYGKPKFIISTSRDITKRKRMDEILRNSEKKLKQEVKVLRKQIQQSKRYPEILGNSSRILQVIDLVHHVARTNSTVLIYGETGSGKDLIAQATHYNSPRRDGPFVDINCAALPEQLIESELFGYVRGAFTGANQNKRGFFEEADKGTILLNEIGDIPLRLQGKLLRVLENQQINRLGQSKSITVDVRIIAASNKDLKQAISKGSFREDLFYRLNVFPIVIPPLREKKEDIPILVKHFLDKFNASMNRQITDISQEAMNMLCRYTYPGNVRELENIIQRSIIMAQGSILLPHHLPEELRLIKSVPVPESLADIEKRTIEDAILRCKGNMSKAAKRLGIGRATLYRKIKKFNITISNYVSKQNI